MIGQIVGNYKIEEKLGEGGMGAVYKGVDTMLDREVAIKALRPELASQTSVVERFRSEAVTLAKLNHPNIAALYTMFRQGEELYMVLEFVRGETLDSILHKRGALTAEEAIPVFCQVLDGIDHAHELGIVHRDIKPANIMLTENGKLKVLDFGIARLLGSARMTRAGNIIGTLEYMAPEQVKGQETDARSDIYALGMMLYEVLTGKTPFETENEFELMKLQTEAMPANPRSINPNIPVEVEAAIMHAIAKDPEERFQTAGDFREILLDAGFAATGAMRGSTGMHQARTLTRPSKPPVSRPEAEGIKGTRLGEPTAVLPVGEPTAVLPVPPSAAGIKETRLGVSAHAVAPAAPAMKATRLGAPGQTINDQPSAPKAAPSFFDKLTWVHYAGAGVAGVFLLGLMVLVPLLVYGLSGSKSSEEVKTPEKNVVPAKEEKPAVVEMPKAPQQTNLPPAQPVEAPPLQAQQPGEAVKPVEDKVAQKPAAPKTAEKPAERPTTVAQKPAAPPKTTAPPKKEKTKTQRDLDFLTGN